MLLPTSSLRRVAPGTQIPPEGRQAERRGSCPYPGVDRPRVLREAKLSTSAEWRSALKRAVGYTMELRAIAGTVAAERTPIPDAFIPSVGRPRKRAKAAQF